MSLIIERPQCLTHKSAALRHGATYRFGDTTRQCTYEAIPVAATQETKVYLPDGVTEVNPEGCILRKLKPNAPGSLPKSVLAPRGTRTPNFAPSVIGG